MDGPAATGSQRDRGSAAAVRAAARRAAGARRAELPLELVARASTARLGG